jgi:hypothetical protein
VRYPSIRKFIAPISISGFGHCLPKTAMTCFQGSFRRALFFLENSQNRPPRVNHSELPWTLVHFRYLTGLERTIYSASSRRRFRIFDLGPGFRRSRFID